jgi:hypothetical protein
VESGIRVGKEVIRIAEDWAYFLFTTLEATLSSTRKLARKPWLR